MIVRWREPCRGGRGRRHGEGKINNKQDLESFIQTVTMTMMTMDDIYIKQTHNIETITTPTKKNKSSSDSLNHTAPHEHNHTPQTCKAPSGKLAKIANSSTQCPETTLLLQPDTEPFKLLLLGDIPRLLRSSSRGRADDRAGVIVVDERRYR